MKSKLTVRIAAAAAIAASASITAVVLPGAIASAGLPHQPSTYTCTADLGIVDPATSGTQASNDLSGCAAPAANSTHSASKWKGSAVGTVITNGTGSSGSTGHILWSNGKTEKFTWTAGALDFNPADQPAGCASTLEGVPYAGTLTDVFTLATGGNDGATATGPTTLAQCYYSLDFATIIATPSTNWKL
jgi:hypothetical protein